MNAPRYAVYFMLDEPKGNASTGGYSTAGAVSAPGAGRVIARIAPMLGLMPEIADAAAIQASLAMPLQPVPRLPAARRRWPGAASSAPGAVPAAGASRRRRRPQPRRAQREATAVVPAVAD